MNLQTLKGFRDYFGVEAKRRVYVVSKIVSIFEKFGFEPLETPALEYAEILKGKYGEEEKLIYQFKTPGNDEVALRYDQTVPLARVIAQYGPSGSQKIILPYRRYQIQSAFRGENPQKGRYREFLQCDTDIVGTASALSDAEILGLVFETYQSLGLDVIIKINDRSLLSKYEAVVLGAIDKLGKIGRDGVVSELKKRGINKAEEILDEVSTLKESEELAKIRSHYREFGYPDDSIKFDPTMVRGLDYYTGLIIEVVLKSDPESSSLGGGGRYDNLIGKFSNQSIPAVGFSVGLDRTIEAMEEARLLNDLNIGTKVLVTVFSSELIDKSLAVCSELRSKNIRAELWLEAEDKLDKQLKYADQKEIPYVVIIGPNEAENNQVTLKDLKNQTQETTTLDAILEKLS